MVLLELTLCGNPRGINPTIVTNFVIFLDFHSTKQGLPSADSYVHMAYITARDQSMAIVASQKAEKTLPVFFARMNTTT